MKSYHHGNLKQELIDCACKLCERDGYTKLSIRTLAKESGVSQTAPYRHFETKEALYASVATDGFKKLHRACYIDINKKVNLSSSLIKSKSNNFPYENISGQGKIMLTIVDGKIVFNDRSFNIK